MAKTEATLQLERSIYNETKMIGTFGCFEVTIGFGGKERVDFITYDTKGIWRCYEIKSSVQDFRSKAKKTFCGHYNYFVLTKEVYDVVKDEVPSHIGIYIGGTLKKNPKKQELKVKEDVLKDSMIRSMYREASKIFDSKDENLVASLKRRIGRLETEKKGLNKRIRELNKELLKYMTRGNK